MLKACLSNNLPLKVVHFICCNYTHRNIYESEFLDVCISDLSFSRLIIISLGNPDLYQHLLSRYHKKATVLFRKSISYRNPFASIVNIFQLWRDLFFLLILSFQNPNPCFVVLSRVANLRTSFLLRLTSRIVTVKLYDFSHYTPEQFQVHRKFRFNLKQILLRSFNFATSLHPVTDYFLATRKYHAYLSLRSNRSFCVDTSILAQANKNNLLDQKPYLHYKLFLLSSTNNFREH